MEFVHFQFHKKKSKAHWKKEKSMPNIAVLCCVFLCRFIFFSTVCHIFLQLDNKTSKKSSEFPSHLILSTKSFLSRFSPIFYDDEEENKRKMNFKFFFCRVSFFLTTLTNTIKKKTMTWASNFDKYFKAFSAYHENFKLYLPLNIWL